jgi:hypothetical protein
MDVVEEREVSPDHPQTPPLTYEPTGLDMALNMHKNAMGPCR